MKKSRRARLRPVGMRTGAIDACANVTQDRYCCEFPNDFDCGGSPPPSESSTDPPPEDPSGGTDPNDPGECWDCW